jgi:hypothetical protein
MEASYIDLANPAHLEFDYMRWLRIVLRTAGARRVLHVGGGACTLARALAAEDPAGRHEVCEIDAEVLALAREHFGLRRTPGLRVRLADGRDHVARKPDDSWDAIVLDAFVGASVPAHLVTVDAFKDAARVAPLTLVNVVDNRARREVRRIATSLAGAYPAVWTIGQRAGNTIVAGCAVLHEQYRVRLAALLAADAAPARLMSAANTARITDAAQPLRDAELA